jgi:hypothetical protein
VPAVACHIEARTGGHSPPLNGRRIDKRTTD